MRTALLLTASLALGACNSNPAPTAEEPTGMAMDNAAATPMASDQGAMPSAAAGEQQFVEAVAASDLFELQSSELAQTKATGKAVKDFAAMMIADHTRSTAELRKAATGTAGNITVIPRLSAQQQADLDALRSADSDFDQLYVQKQVAAHEMAKALLSEYAQTGPAGPLRDFAGKTAQVVSRHLDQARKLPR